MLFGLGSFASTLIGGNFADRHLTPVPHLFRGGLTIVFASPHTTRPPQRMPTS